MDKIAEGYSQVDRTYIGVTNSVSIRAVRKERNQSRKKEKNSSRQLCKAHVVAAHFHFESYGVSTAGAKLGSLRILRALNVAVCIISIMRLWMKIS